MLALSGDVGQVVGRDLDAKVFLELDETCHVERLRILGDVLQEFCVDT